MTRLLVVMLVLVALLVPTAAHAVNESTTQMTLVASPLFLARVQYLMAQQARTVLVETGVGLTHVCRARYAQNVIVNPANFASTASVMVVGGVNLIGTVTGSGATADSTAVDAAILSQLATFWSQLAGCDTGT